MQSSQPEKAARQAITRAGAFIHGHFVFADGEHSSTKIEMDRLWHHPQSLAKVLELLARADGLPPAEVIMGVPRGGEALAEAIAKDYLEVPIAKLERVPGGAKQDFRFVSPADEALASKARSIRIYEDVVTTLSSVAGVVKLLSPEGQDIHSLAIWRRGKVKAKYRRGVTDHYLIEEVLDQYPPADCPICSAKPQLDGV